MYIYIYTYGCRPQLIRLSRPPLGITPGCISPSVLGHGPDRLFRGPVQRLPTCRGTGSAVGSHPSPNSTVRRCHATSVSDAVSPAWPRPDLCMCGFEPPCGRLGTRTYLRTYGCFSLPVRVTCWFLVRSRSSCQVLPPRIEPVTS